MANITYTITQDGEEISYTINDGVGPVGPAGPNNITTATATDITGILKGDGANVSAAVEDTDYQGVLAEGAFIDGDKTKLDGIEAGADVTDAANVDAAGAVMESDYSPAHSVLAQQSGTGSPSSVTLGTNSLLGRASGAGTAIQGLTAAQARTLLNVEDGATADQTGAEILTAIKTVDGTGSGLDADLLDGQDSSAFATSAQGALADSAVQPGDIDTLAELNAIITDATLIDTTDSRLSDARTPTAHTHTASDLDFAGSTDIGADLADADEILVSDGGGNTTRVKSALSRFWTYIKAKIESVGLSSLNITGDLTVDTTTLHVDSANNRVGIGTASPADSADVVGKLLIRNGQDSVGSQNKECVRFGFGSGDNYQHYLATRHNAASTQNAIEFSTSTGVASGSYPANAQHGLTIESGRVGVATGHDTSPANTLQIGTGSIGFTANSATWDGATISGNQSFSGQVELTGQAASTDDSAMTRSLVEDFFEEMRPSRFSARVHEMAFTATTGSGTIFQGASATHGTIVYQTGTTTGSTAGGNSGGNVAPNNPAALAGDHPARIYFNRVQIVHWKTSISANAGCLTHLNWGGGFNSVTGDPTTRAIGIKVDGSNLYLQAHNGSTLTTSGILGTVATNVTMDLVVVSDGAGNVTLYRNGINLGSITGGPTASFISYSVFVERVSNEATTTNHNATVLQRVIATASPY